MRRMMPTAKGAGDGGGGAGAGAGAGAMGGRGPMLQGPRTRESDRGGSMRQMGGVGMLQHHAEDFDLTDEQMDALDAMKPKFEMEKVDLQMAMHKAKIRLRTSMCEEGCAEANVMAAIDEVAKTEADLRKMRYRHLQEARAVLTDDQRAQIKKHRRKMEKQKVRMMREQRQGG